VGALLVGEFTEIASQLVAPLSNDAPVCELRPHDHGCDSQAEKCAEGTKRRWGAHRNQSAM